MPLACNTCRLAFEEPEAHRLHCKSDWHKYNLKRKIVELPVITFEEYEKRESAYTEPVCETVFSCKPCHKNFSSENALSSHINSKKHLDVISKKQTSSAEHLKNVKNSSLSNPKPQSFSAPAIHGKTTAPPQTIDRSKESDGDEEDDDGDWESVNSDDEEMPRVPTNICLFCCHESKNTEENLQHMKIAHSFCIPDAEYVTDLDGLVCYLGQKVAFGFTCLKCNKQKWSLRSVQQHMMDKGHCYMQFEGDAHLEYEDYYDYSASYPEGRVHADEAVNVLDADGDGYAMVLPSGATVWHRSYAVYCRQNIPPTRAVALRTNKIAQGFRALCQSGDLGKVPFYKTNAYKFAMQRQRRYALKLGMKQNKFQPHFRSQVMF